MDTTTAETTDTSAAANGTNGTNGTNGAAAATAKPEKAKKPVVPEPMATKQKFLNAAERAKGWAEDMAEWVKIPGCADAAAAAQAHLAAAEASFTAAAESLASLPVDFKAPTEKRETTPIEYVVGGKYRLRGNTAKLEPTIAAKNVEIIKLYGTDGKRAQVSTIEAEGGSPKILLVSLRDLGAPHDK